MLGVDASIFVLMIFDALWMHWALEDIPTSIVANSDFWKRLWAGDMIIFRLHAGLHVSDIVYLEACWGI